MRKGFTMVELLVVITIIGVLAAIGLTVYSVVLKNGRDAKRQSDMRQIQSAVEQYRADQLYYPMSASSNDCSAAETANKLAFNTTNCKLVFGTKVYMNAVPAEINSTQAQYKYDSYRNSNRDSCDNATTNKCMFYCIYADMENSSNGNTAPATCPIPNGTTYDFTVSVP